MMRKWSPTSQLHIESQWLCPTWHSTTLQIRGLLMSMFAYSKHPLKINQIIKLGKTGKQHGKIWLTSKKNRKNMVNQKNRDVDLLFFPSCSCVFPMCSHFSPNFLRDFCKHSIPQNCSFLAKFQNSFFSMFSQFFLRFPNFLETWKHAKNFEKIRKRIYS